VNLLRIILVVDSLSQGLDEWVDNQVRDLNRQVGFALD